MATVLIVDDEKHTRDGLARALRGIHETATAENGARALAWLEGHRADVVVTDLRMPEMDGLTLLKRLLAMPEPPAVLLLTAYGNVGNAVEAMKAGAYDFLEKPVDLDRLEKLVGDAAASRAAKAAAPKPTGDAKKKPDPSPSGWVGESPAMKAVMETVRQVAPSHATVLIQGESGTGKELVARALHELSGRAKKPFVAVHCAALAPTLLESELFGHERGAFTGAVERKKGRFELADGGTLFLDEIGEISPETQVKILRVLEDRAFERVGGSETLHVDVRVVAATNRDLRAMVAEGRFREDLFYRLFVVNLVVPPLRERAGDIPLIAEHYLRTFAEEYHRETRGIAPEAMRAMEAYAWPGNVRELRNAMERMVVLSRGAELGLADLPPAIAAAGAGANPAPQSASSSMETELAKAEREALEAALAANGGNRAAAARSLGISERTLYRKLARHGLGQ